MDILVNGRGASRFRSRLPERRILRLHGPTLDGKQFAQMLQPEGNVPRVVPEPPTQIISSRLLARTLPRPAACPLPSGPGFRQQTFSSIRRPRLTKQSKFST